jgi:hypothetical protein
MGVDAPPDFIVSYSHESSIYKKYNYTIDKINSQEKAGRELGKDKDPSA